jgi:hypothetical protein
MQALNDESYNTTWKIIFHWKKDKKLFTFPDKYVCNYAIMITVYAYSEYISTARALLMPGLLTHA